MGIISKTRTTKIWAVILCSICLLVFSAPVYAEQPQEYNWQKVRVKGTGVTMSVPAGWYIVTKELSEDDIVYKEVLETTKEQTDKMLTDMGCELAALDNNSSQEVRFLFSITKESKIIQDFRNLNDSEFEEMLQDFARGTANDENNQVTVTTTKTEEFENAGVKYAYMEFLINRYGREESAITYYTIMNNYVYQYSLRSGEMLTQEEKDAFEAMVRQIEYDEEVLVGGLKSEEEKAKGSGSWLFVVGAMALVAVVGFAGSRISYLRKAGTESTPPSSPPSEGI